MSMKPEYPLDRVGAEQMLHALARGGADAAARLTIGWSRRQLIWTCVALASQLTEAPKPPVKPTKIELRPTAVQTRRATNVYYAAEEAQWSDVELREAHTKWNGGDRTPWVVTGERIYQRLKGRRRRAAKAAAEGSAA